MELVILDLATLGAITSIGVLCAMAVAVLPWTDGELRQTLLAARTIPELVGPVFRLLGPVPVAPDLVGPGLHGPGLHARGPGVSHAPR